MSVNITKKEVNLSQIIAKDTYITWIEQEILVPDTKPDVVKILRVEAMPYVSNVDMQDGIIRLGGEITYYVQYRPANDERVKGISLSYPFSQSISVPGVKQNMYAIIKASVRNVIYSVLNERKIALKSELVIKYKILTTDKTNLPTGIEGQDDLQYITRTQEYNNILTIKTENIDVKEDIILPNVENGAVELLKAKATIQNVEYKISYNKLLVKGTLKTTMMYMTNGQQINNYNTDIPFAGMMEIQNISDEKNKLDVNYRISNIDVTLGGIDSNLAMVSADIVVTAIVYEPENITVITDMYSTKNELKYNNKNQKAVKTFELMDQDIVVREKIGSVDKNSTLIDYSVDVESINTKVTNSNLYVNGVLKVNVMYENDETKVVDAKMFEAPIETTITLNKNVEENDFDVEIYEKSSDVQIVQNSIEANITLGARIRIYQIDDIQDINITEETPIDVETFDSMYIYIVKKGDTLWSIAKKYKTTVAKIANVNNIVDENKIDVGQKLLLIR